MDIKSPPVDEKHWFLLAFMVQSPGLWTPHSVVVGSDSQNLSIPQLVELKKANKVPDASIMMGISYLGWMTERAVNGLPDVDPPTIISEAYRLGMVAAARVEKNDPNQAINPYDPTDPSPHIRQKSSEWSAGFVEVRNAQNDTTTEVAKQKLVKPATTTPSGSKAQ